MNTNPVIKNFSYCLAHVPDLVRYGSKPRREIGKDGTVGHALQAVLRSHSAAVTYPPNQVYIGNLVPEELAIIPRPWFGPAVAETEDGQPGPQGVFGEIISQELFFAILKKADVLQPALLELADENVAPLYDAFVRSAFAATADKQFQSAPLAAIVAETQNGSALPLHSGKELLGCFRRDNRAEGREDESLAAEYCWRISAARRPARLRSSGCCGANSWGRRKSISSLVAARKHAAIGISAAEEAWPKRLVKCVVA